MALADNLLAYYKFESDGSDSAGSNTLTGHNSPGFATGKIGNGTNLDGSSMYWQANVLNLTTGAWSMQAWVKISNTSTWHFICGRDDSLGSACYTMRAQTGTGKINVIFSDGVTGDSYFGNTNVCDNAWHHVVILRDGTNVKLYVDGASDMTPGTDDNVNCSNSLAFTVGADYNGQHFFTPGIIDEVGVWQRALSSSEVTQLYNGGSGLAYPWSSGLLPRTMLLGVG